MAQGLWTWWRQAPQTPRGGLNSHFGGKCRFPGRWEVRTSLNFTAPLLDPLCTFEINCRDRGATLLMCSPPTWDDKLCTDQWAIHCNCLIFRVEWYLFPKKKPIKGDALSATFDGEILQYSVHVALFLFIGNTTSNWNSSLHKECVSLSIYNCPWVNPLQLIILLSESIPTYEAEHSGSY